MNPSHKHSEIQNITPEFLATIKLPEKSGARLNYLIVMPMIASSDDDTIYGFPIGIAYVSAALKASGRHVFTLNLNYKSEPEELLRKVILENAIDVIMTGGFSFLFWAIKTVIDTAKATKPDIITVVGGGIVTGDPATAMEVLGNADIGVIGEGEISINALAHTLETGGDPAALDGIICCRDGKWSMREKWPMIPDLNILPYPDYEGFEYGILLNKSTPSRTHIIPGVSKWLSNCNGVAFMSTSRSCYYHCTFCFHTCGNKYRQLSIENIFGWLDWLISLYPGIGMIWLEDELSFAEEDFTLKFCQYIKPYNIKWKCTTHAGFLTEKMLVAMKKSGCIQMCIGLESADNRILKSMRKGITIEQIETAWDAALNVGLFVTGNLIFGDLEETMETVMNSLNWKQAHPNIDSRLGLICAYPGTHLYKVACERGIIKDRIQYLKDGCPPVNVSKLTDDEYNVLPALLNIFRVKDKLQNVTVEPQSDCTVNILGCCPHCFEEIRFEHIEHLFDITSKICPACGRDFSATAIEYCDFEKLSKNAEALLSNVTGAALWGINTFNFYWLLKAMPVLKADSVRFVNKSEIIVPDNGKAVKTLEGKEIFAPDIIERERIDTVMVPNNLKVFDEIKKQCAVEFPHVKRIVHITELV